jgi:hypothetical protein
LFHYVLFNLYLRRALVLRTGGLVPAGLPTDLPGLDLPFLRLALLLDWLAVKLPADLAAFTLTPPGFCGTLFAGRLFLEAAFLFGLPVSVARSN